MTHDRGPLLGTFNLEDEVDTEDVVDILEKFDEDEGYVVIKNWSKGEIDIRKQMNTTLSDIEEEEKEE